VLERRQWHELKESLAKLQGLEGPKRPAGEGAEGQGREKRTKTTADVPASRQGIEEPSVKPMSVDEDLYAYMQKMESVRPSRMSDGSDS